LRGGLFKDYLNSVSVAADVSPLVIITVLEITTVAIITAIPVVVAILIVIGVLAIGLGVTVLKALAVVKAGELIANRGRRLVTETREGIPPPCDQSVIEAPSLLELLPTAICPTIITTGAPPQVLGENA
jgi:hypothetical protein